MFEYCLGLLMNEGLYKIEKIKADSLEEAIHKWENITNENVEITLKNEFKTIQGFKLKMVYSTDSNVVNFRV